MATTTNPVQLPVQAQLYVSISCEANAANYQKVTISYPSDNGTTSTTFTGRGENAVMLDSDGNQYYMIPKTPDGLTLTCTFEFAYPNNPTQFIRSTVQEPTINRRPGGTTYTYGSEDGNDQDFNDAVLTIAIVP